MVVLSVTVNGNEVTKVETSVNVVVLVRVVGTSSVVVSVLVSVVGIVVEIVVGTSMVVDT